MITARAHLLFHGLIELQERDDFLNGTWKATVLKAIHTCVWAAVKLQWIKTFTEPFRAEADNEDFTKKKNGLTCKGHSAFHRGLPSLQHWWAPFWKQPLKPERCTKLARAAACSHPPETQQPQAGTTDRWQWRCMDCVVSSHWPRCTAYHAYYIRTEMKSNEKNLCVSDIKKEGRTREFLLSDLTNAHPFTLFCKWIYL